MKEKKILTEAVGEIDLNELENLAIAGGADMDPRVTPSPITPATPSSWECSLALTNLITASANWASDTFSCGKFC